jgi:hypothetical protein
VAWITFLNGVYDTPDGARVANLDASTFLDYVGDAEKWASVECSSKKQKLAGLGFVCGRYKEGAKSKNNSDLAHDSATDVFVYDIDDMTKAEIRVAALRWREYDCAVYSTWKHTEKKPRLRLLVRLSEAVPNARDLPFKSLYGAGASALGISHDVVTVKVANFFLGPQHMPGTNGQAERMRFRGKSLDVAELAKMPHKTPAALVRSPGAMALADRPDRKEVDGFAKWLCKRKNRTQRTAGEALKAAVKGEGYGQQGVLHDIRVKVAFECVRKWRELDGAWFAEQHLRVSWAATEPGAEKWDYRLGDWLKCVDSARAKLLKMDAEREKVRPAAAAALNEEQIESVEGLRGALVVSYGSSYYVYSPYKSAYQGPFKAAQVAVAFRECLGAMPGVSELDFKNVNGPPGLKSAGRLNHEYGCTIGAVQYYAKLDEKVFDMEENAIRLQAYKWIDWEPRFSACCDELLRVIGGNNYSLLESYLYKFRDLDQPLPALTLVGTQGVWKSQIAQALSRFWGHRDAPTPCRPEKVLFKFAAPLLQNPVIWSDEKLASDRGEHGIPERYRESISERVHQVEMKGVDPLTLFSCTRHVISVNEEEKVFSAEVDASSVEATMIRFLVLRIRKRVIERFEEKWTGTDELERLREGSALLEHVRWIEENTEHASQGRFWVDTASDLDMVWRARFADETLNYCLMIALDCLIAEQRHSVPGQVDRLPLVCDSEGQLRISPDRINAAWGDSDVVAGSRVKKPAPTTIGRYLIKAGFKADLEERASKSRLRAWKIDHTTLKRFIENTDRYTWDDLKEAVKIVFKASIRDKSKQ